MSGTLFSSRQTTTFRPIPLLVSRARASDEYVNEAAGAFLPTRQSRRVEDADQRSHEVVGVGFGPQFAAGYCAFDRSDERRMDETSGAFDQPNRPSSDRIHGRNDEQLAGHVVDE